MLNTLADHGWDTRRSRWSGVSSATSPRPGLAGYTVRAFGHPTIDSYFGGAFARALEHEGDGAMTAATRAMMAHDL